MFQCSRYQKNNCGFSIIQVMLASGLVAGAMASLLSIKDLNTNIAVNIEKSLDQSQILNSIIANMLNESACINTLKATSSSFYFPEKTSIKFKTRNNEDLFSPDTMIQPSSTKSFLKKAEIVENKKSQTHDGQELTIEFTFSNTPALNAKMDKNEIISPERLVIFYKIDPLNSANLFSCYALYKGVLDDLKSKLCSQLGGNFDKKTQNCHLLNYDSNAENSDLKSSYAVSTQYLEDYINFHAQDLYIHKTGRQPDHEADGEMEGPLIVTENLSAKNAIADDIISSEKICTNLGCRILLPQDCPKGQILQGINKDGTLFCKTFKCANNDEYIQSIFTNGEPKCIPFPNKDCGEGQYIENIDSSGNVQCRTVSMKKDLICGEGFVLQGVDEKGEALCLKLPASSKIATGGLKNLFGKSCKKDEFMTGFTSEYELTCKKLPHKVTYEKEYDTTCPCNSYSYYTVRRKPVGINFINVPAFLRPSDTVQIHQYGNAGDWGDLCLHWMRNTFVITGGSLNSGLLNIGYLSTITSYPNIKAAEEGSHFGVIYTWDY